MNKEEAASVLQFLLPSLEREHAVTAKVLAAVPEHQSNYKPDPNSMSAMELVWHIAATEQFFMEGATRGEFPPLAERPATVSTPQQVVDWYKAQFAANLERVKQMSGDDLVREVMFHGKFPLSGLFLIQLMISHSVHHRGQLSVYLRPMGARVPSIYGSSGDDERLRAGEATA